MNELPGIVATYLKSYAPKGDFIGYWLDRRGDYIVLVLYQRDGEYYFSVGAFPQVVGHWGHQLGGADFTLEPFKAHLRDGLWDADKQMQEKVRALVERIEREGQPGSIRS